MKIKILAVVVSVFYFVFMVSWLPNLVSGDEEYVASIINNGLKTSQEKTIIKERLKATKKANEMIIGTIGRVSAGYIFFMLICVFAVRWKAD